MAKKKSYWGRMWKKGTRVLVTDGDWTIGRGIIVGFKDLKKLWAIVKLDKIPKDYRGYHVTGKPGYALAYKCYTYRFSED